ncbi:MAG TPA: ZIP family metal transporter, partial [Verrucomicrobiae bacterium]|nr:ZIP family metal transporter [Verrucomicrobiae bacterium]
ILYLVSFAVGALFGDAVIHILPESYEQLGRGLDTSLWVMGGILGFFLLEKFLRWRHCHVMTPEEEHLHPVVSMNLVGDFVHNFIDGLMIGVSYSASLALGLTTTLAVLFHEIPQEIGDFGILVHGGLPPRKAIFYNLLSSFGAFVGVALALIVGVHVRSFGAILLPITAGGFIYIAGSDLIPELHHDVDIRTSSGQLIMIVLGVAVMAALKIAQG